MNTILLTLAPTDRYTPDTPRLQASDQAIEALESALLVTVLDGSPTLYRLEPTGPWRSGFPAAELATLVQRLDDPATYDATFAELLARDV